MQCTCQCILHDLARFRCAMESAVDPCETCSRAKSEASTARIFFNTKKSSGFVPKTVGGGGGGGSGRSIVSALERTMSRSTFGGGGKSGERVKDPTFPQREKNRSEELFGTLMGQDSHDGRRGSGATGWGHGDGQGGGDAGGKETGKNEVDLGFLHR